MLLRKNAERKLEDGHQTESSSSLWSLFNIEDQFIEGSMAALEPLSHRLGRSLRSALANRTVSRLAISVITVTAIWVAYKFWGRWESYLILTAAVAPLLLSLFWIMGAAFANRASKGQEEESEVVSGRNVLELMGDLGTDILIAVFLSICVAILIAGIVESEKQGPHAGIINEGIKEAFYAASVALVSFATLIMLRTSLLVQSQLRTDLSLRRAESLLKNLLALESSAVIVTGEAGAGSALASLLGQESFEVKPEPRSERLRVLTAAGRCAEYWISFAYPKCPPNIQSEEHARGVLLLTAAKEFLRESASDIARSNHLVVSNIGYVTSLLCSTLIALDNLPPTTVGEGAKGQVFRPVWLAFTTYEPDLWFDEVGGFLNRSGLPAGAIHLQYWGRYLRVLKYLMTGDRAPICIRVFCVKHVNNAWKHHETVRKYLDDREAFRHCNVSDCLVPDTIGTDVRLTYRLVSDHPAGKADFTRNLALALALDAAGAVSEASLQTTLGGDLEKRLLEIKQAVGSDPDAVSVKLEEWYQQHGKNVGLFVRSVWEKIQDWELRYLSGGAPGTPGGKPRIRKLDKTRELLALADPSFNLSFIDGHPLEVMLDALLLFAEAKQAETIRKGPSALLHRWHAQSGAAAYYVVETEASTKVENCDVDALIRHMPADGDFHAFGRVPIGEPVEWKKAEWLMAMKSAMDGPLGMARVDFLDIQNNGSAGGCISLDELMDPDGEYSTSRLVQLSAIIERLQDKPGDDFHERFEHDAAAPASRG
jgi:hypothetical protein